MQAIAYVVIALHVVSAIGLIIFVLLHSGKGTGLSTMLGGAMPATSTGTGIIEKNLDRITIGFGVMYAVTAIVLMLVYRPAA